jgi:hypothetical protein
VKANFSELYNSAAAEAYEKKPDYSASDQGVATGAGNTTIKDFVDSLGTDHGTIVLTHSVDGDTTSYTLTTSETIPSNIKLVIKQGAVIDGAGTLTINGPFEGSPGCFGSSITVKFGDTSSTTIEVEWFSSDPYTNGFGAINKAIRAAVASTGYGQREIHIPAGIYTIDTTGVFSDIGTTSKKGIHIYGDGWGSTRLVLSPVASDLWFYDNGVNEVFQFMTFSDISFWGFEDPSTKGYTDISNYAKGFKETSSGHEQGFKFHRCWFSGLYTVMDLEGTNNASENHFFDCKITKIKDCVLLLNNAQALNTEFHGTDIEVIYGDVIRATAAVGAVKMFGGSLIMSDGAGSNKYLVNISAAVSSNAGPYLFTGVRLEMDSNYAKLVNITLNSPAKINFADCTFWSSSVTAIKTDWVKICGWAIVAFDRCQWSWNDSSYYEKYTLAAGGQYGVPGKIIFRNCCIHEDLSTHITDSGWGRVSAINCYGSNYGAFSSEPRMKAIDFDYFARGLFDGGNEDNVFHLKTASIMYTTWWPHSAAQEHTLLLPQNAVIKSILVKKPAAGTNTAAYQLSVGTDDKATVYGSSTLAEQKDEHTIILSNQFIECGTLTNTRTIRLWDTQGLGTDLQTGGYAIVEYY